MKNILTYGVTALLLTVSACSDMPTSSSDDEELAFTPAQRGTFETLSKIGQVSFTTDSTAGLNATALTIGTPASSAGNFLVAQVTVTPLKSTEVICAPSGWTSIIRTNLTDKVAQQIFHRTVSAGEPASHTWQFRKSAADCGSSSNTVATKAVGGIIAFSDVDVSHPSGPIFGASGTSAEKMTSIVAPTITGVPAGSWVLWFFGNDNKVDPISTSGAGSEIYSEQNIKSDGKKETPSAASADDEQDSDGSSGAESGSTNESNWVAQTVVIRAANTAPTLSGVPASATIDELVLYSFDADATDADYPAQTLTFSLQGSVPAGASIDGSSGVFSWTPAENQDGGPYSITVRVTDSGSPAMYDEETVSITVNDVNSAPTLSNVPSEETICEGALYSFDADASDGDVPAQTLTFSLQGSVPAGASINSSTGVFTWTPGENQDGAFSFEVRVTDNGADGALYDEQTIDLTVSEANVAPVLDLIGNQAVIAENLLSFTATASDADFVDGSANALTFSLEGAVPAGASINGSTGEFTWTPTAAQAGPYSVTVRVTDDGPDGACGEGAQYDEETFSITVDVPPVTPGTLIVDIKPGTEVNSVNCTNVNGVIPVALLSTTDFDATAVDHTTVMFEGAPELHVNKKTYVAQRHEEDVNLDGLKDLVFHFAFSQTTLTCDSVEGTLTGMTYGGEPFEGADGINMH